MSSGTAALSALMSWLWHLSSLRMNVSSTCELNALSLRYIPHYKNLNNCQHMQHTA
jgi:hypothetical protein